MFPFYRNVKAARASPKSAKQRSQASSVAVQVKLYVRVENLTEEQIRELRIIDNKLNESDWDMDLLKDDLYDLNFDDFDIDFGLDEDDEEFDESDLDEDKTKTDVQLSIHFKTLKDYEAKKDEIQRIADEVGATVAVKMI